MFPVPIQLLPCAFLHLDLVITFTMGLKYYFNAIIYIDKNVHFIQFVDVL